MQKAIAKLKAAISEFEDSFAAYGDGRKNAAPGTEQGSGKYAVPEQSYEDTIDMSDGPEDEEGYRGEDNKRNKAKMIAAIMSAKMKG